MPDKKPTRESTDSMLQSIQLMIEQDFPMIKVQGITVFHFQGDDLVGIFKEESGIAYSFFIEANKPHPMIQRL